MWNQPHFTYSVSGAGSPASLAQLEHDVPGVLVYGRNGSGSRQRLAKALDRGEVGFSAYEINVPIHGAWLVEALLNQMGLSYQTKPHGVSGIEYWRDDEDWRIQMMTHGRNLVERATMRGELREHVMAMATPYQYVGVAWATSRPWVLDVWSCGAGKTLGALLACLAQPGPVLVVCPAKARHVWWSQVQEYTHIEPFRVRPASEQRKGEPTLQEYLTECRQQNRRPFVIIGAESLPDNMTAAAEVHPSVIIFDALHIHGSRKRWRAVPQADGSVKFEKRKTKASQRSDSKVDRENRAVAVMEVSRMSCVKRRIGLTATPLDDGRPRRLWSQLDLLNPGGFAHSYSKFAHRYCDARPGQFGGLNDKGSSNLQELKARCSFLVHEVPYSESHAALPSTRTQVVYLSPSELNRAERWSDKETFGQAIKGIVKDMKVNPLAKERVIEARLAESCSRKRRYIVGEVLEGLKGGGKVVVFTARRRETEKWAEEISKALKKGDEAQGDVPVWMGHGGVSESEREIMVDTFRESTGPCCLIGTGQAFGTAVDGLQTASLAIFAMLPWKPGDFVQWKGRFDRLGGGATLLKVVVASGTYDERVVEILVEKFGPIEQFLQADELAGMDEKLLGMEDRKSLMQGILNKLEPSDG